MHGMKPVHPPKSAVADHLRICGALCADVKVVLQARRGARGSGKSVPSVPTQCTLEWEKCCLLPRILTSRFSCWTNAVKYRRTRRGAVTGDIPELLQRHSESVEVRSSRAARGTCGVDWVLTRETPRHKHSALTLNSSILAAMPIPGAFRPRKLL